LPVKIILFILKKEVFLTSDIRYKEKIMKKYLRYFLFFGLVIMVLVFCVVLLANCTGKKDGKDGELSGEIVIWAWSESEITGLAERFNETYPNIKVRFVPVESSGYLMKFQTALMAGSELPDVALQEIGVRGPLYALDCWENLERPPYNFDRNMVFPQLLPIMTNERNEIFGIERELNPSGLIYKRPLVKEYLGTDDPQTIGALLADWDDFIELGQKVAAASGGKVKMLPGLRELSNILLEQYSEKVFENNRVYATKFFRTNLDIMIRLKKADAVGRLQTFSPAWNASFLDNEHIFYPCAPWTAQWILKPNDPDSTGRWGITTAPVKAYSYGGTAYGIPSRAKNKYLAWKFIEWATTTDEGIQACKDVVGAIVSKKSAYEQGYPAIPDPYFAGIDPNAYLMENAAPTMEIRLINQYDVVLSDVMALMVDRINNNPNITLDNAVRTAVTETRNKLPAYMEVE
jgi:multiple sugar transport system substrate-binding protein